jgi:3-oxoacyl-[acyl-carrier protein] reductase
MGDIVSDLVNGSTRLDGQIRPQIGEENVMINPGLEGKIVLITGANNPFGIGAATVRAFSVQGAKAFLTYLCESPETYGVSEEEAKKATTPSKAFGRYQNSQNADRVIREVRESGGEVEAMELDLARAEQIPRLFDAVEKARGQVDILVNNATHNIHPDNVLDTTAERIDRHFAVNTRAIVLMMQEFGIRHIRAKRTWGRIINISTDSYIHLGNTAYGASKHAMESYSRAAAHELGPYGITVNIVSPGPVQTGHYDEAVVTREERMIPLGRIGRPEDIANAIVFFASNQASWITGQRLYVGGGHNM